MKSDRIIDSLIRERPEIGRLMERLGLRFASELPANPKPASEWPEYRDGLTVSEYWDNEYGKEDAWQKVRFRHPVKVVGKALLVTLEDDTEMYVPQFICKMWHPRAIDVHTLHWEELLAERQSAEDLLPDLDDDEI